MSFNSLSFLVFFPVVVMIYFILPQKIKYIWLLIASYYFYMSWNAQYALLIGLSTVITYLSGILIEREETQEKKKLWVALSFIINLAILFFFKYFDFALNNINMILSRCHIQVIEKPFDVLLPVGISFYTFQALSYTMDVYRGELKCERNILKYALFVSFFPQLVAGPIERSKNLVGQISEEHYFDAKRVVRGLLLMLWGLFMKLVIADRMSVFVDTVYERFETYSGLYILVAVLGFSLQLYCDFASYSNIAIGAANVMGFELMQNFRQPYFSVSLSELWRRWHISLSSWFRDYLYIPLGGNRKGTFRKYVNLMIVFLLSGLWHGAAWGYIVWGGLNGAVQVLDGLTVGIRARLNKIFCMREESFSHRFMGCVATYFIWSFLLVFFRARSVGTALAIFKNMFAIYNPWIFFDGKICQLGLDVKDMCVLVLAVLVLLAVDILSENGVCIRDFIMKQEWWFRWLCYIGFVVILLVFGVYGPGFNAAAFIYFQF